MNSSRSNFNQTDEWAQECSSKLNIEELSFTWTVENMSLIYEELQIKTMESAKFYSKNGVQWQIVLGKKAENEDSEDSDYYGYSPSLDRENLGVFLKLLSNPSNRALNVLCNFNVLIGTKNEVIYKGTKFNGKFSLEPEGRNACFGDPAFIARMDLFDERKGYMVDDKLKIRWDLQIIRKSETMNHSEFLFENELEDNQIQARTNNAGMDYSHLYQTQKFSDVEIIDANGVGIKAHKCVLANFSPVFSAMFENPNMLEGRESKVTIDDVEPKVLTKFIEFMYFGKSNELDVHAKDLLIIAEKYQVEKLKQLCENYLSRKVDHANIFEILELSSFQNSSRLKLSAMNYIKRSRKPIFKKKGWKIFMTKNADLANEIILNALV